MNAALARLVGQLEVHAATLGRRAVESVTEPLRQKSHEIVAEAVEAATRAIKVVVVKAALGVMAGITGLIALAFAAAALDEFLVGKVGVVDARLIMAGGFAALAVIAVLLLVFWPGSSKPATATVPPAVTADARRAVAQASVAAPRAAAIPPPAAEPDDPTAAASVSGLRPEDLKGGVDAIAALLGEAGFRREQAGLRAGLALSSQLKPMQIVALALIGGFIVGVRPSRRH